MWYENGKEILGPRNHEHKTIHFMLDLFIYLVYGEVCNDSVPQSFPRLSNTANAVSELLYDLSRVKQCHIYASWHYATHWTAMKAISYLRPRCKNIHFYDYILHLSPRSFIHVSSYQFVKSTCVGRIFDSSHFVSMFIFFFFFFVYVQMFRGDQSFRANWGVAT